MSFVARPGRIDLRVPIVVDLGGERITGETRNIGIGGVFVATRKPAPVGQRVLLHLTLPRWDESLAIEGEVRWARADEIGAPGMGVRFVRPPIYVAAALDNFVRSYARGG